MTTNYNYSGLFIALEGIDGTGKSTQTQRLASYFSALGREVVLSREPTDGPWGNKLRESATIGRLDAEQELEYFLRDRKDHVENLILPSLHGGKVVILDRYYFSTMAYQGCRGFDPAEIRRRNEEFAPRPDHLFILDIDVETALQRIGHRGDKANHFEKTDSLKRCRDIFLTLVGESFVHLISAHGTPDEITLQLIDFLEVEK